MHSSIHAERYGTQSVKTMAFLIPSPFCATSPCFVSVAVEAGLSVTVAGSDIAVVEPFIEAELLPLE
jgi:hypothetical protein